MISELLARSPLLVAPLAAMVGFLVLFVAIVIRAITRSQAYVDAAARLPLDVCEGQEVRDGLR
jgi:hypothetical protein